jgi:hypothetical protein
MSEHKLPKPKQTMPVFVFARRHDIEVEAGFILAGNLIVDLLKKTEPTEDEKQMVAAIIQQLTDAAQSGRMPDDAVVYGWRGGHRPPNAVDIDDDKLMAAWAKDRCLITLRVDPRSDGLVRLDSDIVRQLSD